MWISSKWLTNSTYIFSNGTHSSCGRDNVHHIPDDEADCLMDLAYGCLPFSLLELKRTEICIVTVKSHGHRDISDHRQLHQLLDSLTHWGRVTQICVSKLTIIGPDNGLSPGRRQAIIWNNAGIFLIGPSGTNFSENLIGIQTFSFKKMHFKMSSAKCRPFCRDLNVSTKTDCIIDTLWTESIRDLCFL